ncbi:MAG: polysaccharide deacetylase family protein [Acidobacteriaceae bacterium]|nr:polysaccharide deacetylase family protein [Acidobacteriaceae bacterium]
MSSPLLIASTVATAAVAAVSVATYATLSPGSQLCGRTLIAGNDPSQIALTFDDGPNPAITPALLDLLAEHNVRATFFAIGRFVRSEPELLRRVHAAGHIVGNHTETHPWLAWQSNRRIAEELRACNQAIEDVLGAPVRFFRPPHGARRTFVLRTARELGLTTVQWNCMGKDWMKISAEQIVRNLQSGISRAERNGHGANLLLHDGSDTGLGADRHATVAAVRTLLQILPKRGKHFVTVDKYLQ